MTALPDIAGLRAVRWLGQGAFGRVYLAVRESDGVHVAVKLAIELGDPRYAREARALARIGPPAVAGLLGQGMAPGGEPYLVLEALAGPDLRTWIAQRPVTERTLDERLAVFGALAKAVDAIHARGVVHRDIKPANVVLRDDGSLAVVNLGIALLPGDAAERDVRLTATGMRIGTAAYMAPEQCVGDVAVDARADLYALGVILFELATGAVPFEGDGVSLQAAHVARRPPRASQVAASPSKLDAVIERCLAKNPRDRFASAAAIVAAIAARDSGETHPTPGAAAPIAASARRPVALLGVWTASGIGALANASDRRAVVARGDALPYVLAFPELAAEAGIREATAVAARLPADARCSVHVADVLVRTTARGIVLVGSAVSEPERWFAGSGGAAVELTRDASLLAEASFTAGATGQALPDVHRVALRGRDTELANALAEAALCRELGRPRLVTIDGEIGLGKSRMLDEIARGLGDWRIVRAAASAPDLGDPERALRELVLAAFDFAPSDVADPAPKPSPDDVEARLASDPGWPAIALACDALRTDDPRAASVLEVPNRVRQEAARLLAAAFVRHARTMPTLIVLDDAQWADHATLDALELAARDAPDTRLCIVVATTPSLATRRPAWGARATATRIALAALDDEHARGCLLDLLAPIEFVPESVIERLLRTCGGVPVFIVEIVHALKRSGAVRMRPGTGAWFVASDELLQASSSPVAERIATRLLARLDAGLLELAQLCAVLADPLDPGEIRKVQDVLDDAREQRGAMIDAGVGLERLWRRGLLAKIGRNPPRRPEASYDVAYAMRHPLLRDAVRALTPPDVRRQLHEAAWRVLEARRPGGGPALARLARHAAAAGGAAAAAAAFVTLAEQARRRHRYVDAEQDFSAALGQLAIAPDAAAREAALAGRAWIRNRLERWLEALADVRAARAIAEQRGDRVATADRWLDEATLHDFREDRVASWHAVEAARSHVEATGDRRLQARWYAAAGRSHFRSEQMVEAIDALARAADAAVATADLETRVEALLLLGPALVSANDLGGAEARLDEVIALCAATGDRLHLGAAYINRMWLWEIRDDVERAVADQQRAVALAREIGHADLERYPTHNLAELLLAVGDLEQAEQLARRSRELQLRHHDRPGPEDTLLLARVLAARAIEPEARSLLAWLAEHVAPETMTPSALVQVQMIELAIAARFDDAAWTALYEQATATATGEQLAVALAAAQAARRCSDDAATIWIERGRELAVDSPRWTRRFAALVDH